MKKSIINLLLCAAAIVLGVSCQKETNADNAEFQLEDCSVSADVLGADTKVVLDGTTPKWEANDQILVLDANKKPLGGTGLFTITSGSGTNTGNFSGKKYIGQTPAYAIYPASVYVAATGKFTLPAAQDGTKESAFNKYAVMMGTVLSGNITFANVCSILKINTGDYGKSGGEAAIKSLKVSAATSAIAGEFTPDWTNNTIAPVADDASLDVTASAASSYANGTDVYLAIFPTSSQALTFEFTNTNNEVATVTDTFAPATNTIKGLGTAGGMEFKTTGTQLVSVDGTLYGKPITPDNMWSAIQLEPSTWKPDKIEGTTCIDILDVVINENADIRYFTIYNPAFQPATKIYCRQFPPNGLYVSTEYTISQDKTARIAGVESFTLQINILL